MGLTQPDLLGVGESFAALEAAALDRADAKPRDPMLALDSHSSAGNWIAHTTARRTPMRRVTRSVLEEILRCALREHRDFLNRQAESAERLSWALRHPRE